MSHSSETTIQDPFNFKPCKIKLSFIIPNLMKSLLAICIFAAILLFFSSSNWRINCPECDKTLFRSTFHQLSSGNEEKTNISHILFGIGGSAETWNLRRRYCELWWKPNVTRGFVWLDEEPRKGANADPWPETSPPYKVSADTARFKYTSHGSRSAVRIARIVKENFELGLKNVRWFVMGDDDTVFFTENLVNVLNKYDYREMYYIGGNSESVEQNVFHTYSMGYGGGGFAVSYPLAAALVRIVDGCIDRYADLYGSDLKIGSCINEIGVPVTKELGFHQMDIRGSPYGLLSTHPLAPLVSLHHLDYLQPLFQGTNRVDSVKKVIKAYEHDPSRTLQYSFCYDPTRKWSISISWGYTVQLYPYFVTAKDLSTTVQTFLTWGSWSQEPFTFNTRVMSLKPCERPILFYFDTIQRLGEENTLTSYKKSHIEQRKKCDAENYKAAYLIKGFNVSAGVLGPEFWKKAPRRQCCEITSGSDELDGVVQVRIRSCNKWESVTPP